MQPQVRASLTLAAVAALGAAALVAVAVAARGGEFRETDWKLLGTVVAVLYCGSAAAAGGTLVARRTLVPLGLGAIVVAAITFALLCVVIWNEGVWQNENAERLGKVVATALAAVLAALVVTSLRLQLVLETRAAAIAYAAATTLILVTAAFAIALLWAWDSPVFDGGDGPRGGIDEAAKRALLALFALSVFAYLATPLFERALLRVREPAARSRE